MKKASVGFAFCGSYCTYDQVFPALQKTAEQYETVLPIVSEHSAETDTRFGTANELLEKLETITGHHVLKTIPDVEPIGPQKLLDVLVIAPCTGNTVAKIASAIVDTSVTMAAKAHLRNGRPVIIAISTNDGLSANAQNIGALLARKNIYFVPFRQDDPIGKPTSLVADMDLIPDTIEAALQGKQLQPLLKNI